MKPRRSLAAPEVQALHERIQRRLDRIGLETQPRVAVRLIELAQRPEAQIKDYVEAIKVDWALTGRMLRLANSAYYAQRAPVTKLERALVALGIERTKAISLGFSLGRSVAGAGARDLARQVWGQSVYRATLASALARTHAPGLAGEAFVVGLLLDCGQPLMARLVGPAYLDLHGRNVTPAKLFQTEHEQLEFTHVDVVAALCKRWRLPEILSRPICTHHSQPVIGRTSDQAALLHRVAYYVGAIQLTRAGLPRHQVPLPSIADRLFKITSAELERTVENATHEYGAIATAFADSCDAVEDVEALAEGVQTQLVELIDEQMARAVRLETRGGAERFAIGNQQVELEPGRKGEVVAYISSRNGERLISCTVDPLRETAETVGRLLGLDDAPAEDLGRLMGVMRSMAA